MGRIIPALALLALLFSSSILRNVFANDSSSLSLEEQILEIQQKLEELFSSRNERLKQITAENRLLRQTVDNLAWGASLLEESMKSVELDHNMAEWNITRVSGQFDNTMTHQQFCASDNSLQDLLDEYYSACGAPPPSIMM
ncbi:uncharacterized protein LOC119766973 [Culex quinquefasciatus]|uniref:uncharacterized protein LOC119766973 n=1 Tax=Culex quinquefasciatus TaxID=7176 RepID=UPI0018E36771|nr:uncharacterized protein LOC119766973 [Culex quinquefasciatus]